MAITFLSEGSEEDYAKYLSLQGTTLEPYPAVPSVSEEEILETIRDMRKVLQRTRELQPS